jgi:sugar lactone lactonase YvrE
MAYLSTDVGIIVINLIKKEIQDTYVFTKNSENIPVKSLTAEADNFYAVTLKGIYTISKQNPKPQVFSEWNIVDTGRYYVSAASYNNKIYAATVDSIFTIQNNVPDYTFSLPDSSIRNLDSGTNGLWICRSFDSIFRGQVLKLNDANQAVDSFDTKGFPQKVIEFPGNTIWIADKYYGVVKREGNDPKGTYVRYPLGPNSASSYDIYVDNQEILIAHGGYTQFYTYTNNGEGFSYLKNDFWLKYQLYDYPPFGYDTYDFVKILKGPDGNVYAASSQSGLFILKPDDSYEHLKGNSILDTGIASGGKIRVHGLAFDKEGNLWVNVFSGAHQLAVRTKAGDWYEYYVPYTGNVIPNGASNIIVDQNGLKWYSLVGGGGLVVFDDNGTIENPADDSYRQLLTGEGTGNLPDNDVYCIAEDKNGAIWFGTANGIGIINCPSDVIARECEGELRIVQYDEFAGYLFQNEVVRALAVDGANRKWIGTNNGVWQISADGNQIIQQFTAENSPLPSNKIQDIAIDPVTGDVYIGTEEGMVSYRGTAIEGGKENTNVVSFPNPVPSGYAGTIAIKGLVENADVRITDISGQLVYRTKALGGQAVWNGKDYNGRRPQSGVYLIFITNRDGSQTHVGKMVFME